MSNSANRTTAQRFTARLPAHLAGLALVAVLALSAVHVAAETPASDSGSAPAPPFSADVWDPLYLRYEFGLGADLVDRASMPPSIRLISPGSDEEWLEGSPATIRYETTGLITRVRIYYYGGNCELGGRSRGSFGRIVADMVSATGSWPWRVPWVDAASFRLRVAGFNQQGERLAEYECTVRFRPREAADLPDTCIAIIKRMQRLYYYRDGRVARMHIISTAIGGYTTPNMKPGSYSSRRGEMGKVFYKAWAPRSRMYDVVMPYYLAITSSGSHGIHATSRNMYRYLGRPASHGCVRQHRSDAAVLYDLVAVGTPVYVF